MVVLFFPKANRLVLKLNVHKGLGTIKLYKMFIERNTILFDCMQTYFKVLFEF